MPVTLIYRVRGGLKRSLVMIPLVRDVVLDHGELEKLGLEVVTDQTIGSSSPLPAPVWVARVVTLRPQAARAAEYPAGQGQLLIDATRQLFKEVLAMNIPALVYADEPVFT